MVTKALASALARVPHLGEWIDRAQVRDRDWPAWRAAIHAVHAPAGTARCRPTTPPGRGWPMTRSLPTS